MPVHLRNLHSTDIEQIIKLANNNALADDMCTLPVPFSTSDAQDLVDRSNSKDEVVLVTAMINLESHAVGTSPTLSTS